MNYRSYKDLVNTIWKNLHKLPEVDLVVGIPRSGIIPASIIALQLNKPFLPFDSFIKGQTPYTGERMRSALNSSCLKKDRKVLIVDDSTNSGWELKKKKEEILNNNTEGTFYFLCVYGSPNSFTIPDICLELLETPRIFQWNILNHKYLENACLDLDGVLCVDPKYEQNDDGARYREFCLNAKPLFIPFFRIGHIVTSRLEKYRPETEEWLKSKGIKYNELHMMQYKTAKERREDNKYGDYKARVYLETNSILFIESERKQARIIHKLSKKPVFCTNTAEFYPSHIIDETIEIGLNKTTIKDSFSFIILRSKSKLKKMISLGKKIFSQL